MANFESVKVAGEAVLDGVQVELEKRDGSVVGVTFTDAAGHVVRAVSDGWGTGLKVLVPAKPKLVKKWAVRGKVLGIAVDETFASEYDASRRRDELADSTSAVDVKVAEVEVPEEAA